MPLTETIAAAGTTIASINTALTAALAVETLVAHVVKRIHDAEIVKVDETPTGTAYCSESDGIRKFAPDGGLQITITIPKFKLGRIPEASKPLP